jgi:ATP-dependent Zn protease
MAMTLEACAYHEAGHAVVARVLGCKVKSITISPRCGSVEMEESPPTAEDAFILAWAGRAAQKRYDPASVQGTHDDFQQAHEISKYGISEERVGQLIGNAHDLVAEHWPAIEEQARKLLTSYFDEREREAYPPEDA